MGHQIRSASAIHGDGSMPAETPRGLEALARAGESHPDHRARRADHADGWGDRRSPEDVPVWSCDECDATEPRAEVLTPEDGYILLERVACGSTEFYRHTVDG